MFRQIVTILLIAAFSVQNFNRAFVLVDYYVNTSHYIKNCENKAAPDMHCEGKCEVSKKMKEEDRKDQQNPGRKATNHNEVVSSKSHYATLSIRIPEQGAKFAYAYQFSIPTTIGSEIFHPPGLI